MHHSVPSIQLKDKTLVVPGCSASLVDNFAIDWIIESINLERVCVFDSVHVNPLVQGNAFGGSQPTTAMELFSLEASELAVLQIRSMVTSKNALAHEIVEFARKHNIPKILIIAAASGHLLSGEALESQNKIRTIDNTLTLDEYHNAGILKPLMRLSDSQVGVSGIVVMTSGMGFVEARLLSEELAERFFESMRVKIESMRMPLSIKLLETAPEMKSGVARIF
jgi:predicted ATP-grasp superfamily ATP-dependent carboligase